MVGMNLARQGKGWSAIFVNTRGTVHAVLDASFTEGVVTVGKGDSILKQDGRGLLVRRQIF